MPTIATLCYVIKHDKILLIKKKKGIGAGFWNGPGGKVEAGEAAEDAAKRECYEEVGIIPEAPAKVAELVFHYGEDEWVVHVFVADDYDGIERETEEAVPKWFLLPKIPYEEMWPDDAIWLPLVLEGKKFTGVFRIDPDTKALLSHEIKEIPDGSVV